MAVDRKDETPERRVARHLSEMVLENHPGGGRFIAVPSEGFFMSKMMARLDPGKVGSADFMGSIAMDGGLPLREDAQERLVKLREELVRKGIVKEADANQVRVVVERKQEGESQFATMEGKGGTHVDAMLVIPIAAVDAMNAQSWALAARGERAQEKTEKTVDTALGKVGMTAILKELARRDPQGFRDSMMELLLADRDTRKNVTELTDAIRDSFRSGQGERSSSLGRKEGGWRENFGHKPQGPNVVE